MKKARHYPGLRAITARLFPDLTSLRQITIRYGKNTGTVILRMSRTRYLFSACQRSPVRTFFDSLIYFALFIISMFIIRLVQKIRHIFQADPQSGGIMQQCRRSRRQYARHAQHDQ